MIISYKHRFIHIHNRKCAGSSINALLCRHLGDDDIMLDSWGDALAAGCRYNRRFYRDFATPSGLVSLVKFVGPALRRGHRLRPVLFHEAYKEIYRRRLRDRVAFPPAETVKRWMASDWDQFFKFCVVRNPYAKAVSDYRWRTRNLGQTITFREFLERASDPRRPDPEGVVPSPVTNWELYTINGRIIVDHIIRFENLAEDLAEALLIAGLPSAVIIPHAKNTGGSDHRDWYGDVERRLVERLYAQEIHYFGYGF